MLIAIFSNYFILLSILGYSFLFKQIIFRKSDVKVENIDIFFGLSLLLFLSLLINFFFPLKLFSLLINIIGFLIFLIGKFYKKVFKIDFLIYFLVIVFITFVSFSNENNVDSPMYHLQVLKWLTEEKINLGLANLEIRFGFNSSWHSIIALLDLNLFKQIGSGIEFKAKYYINAVLLSVIVYEVLKFKKKFSNSDIFLFLVNFFLIFFSFVHPQMNGVILNHLGNPERDIAAMVFVIMAFYIFLKIEENNGENIQLISLLFFICFLSVTTRIVTLPLIILCVFILIKKKEFKTLGFTNIFIFFTGLIWTIRSFFLSGCFVFPIKFTCFNTIWAVNIKEVIFVVNEAMSYTRTHPHPNSFYNDWDHTIYSYDWFMPWVNRYFLTTSILQIASIITIFSISILLFLKFYNIYKKKNKNFISHYDFIIILTLSIIFIIWFKAPEIRYAWGPIIILPCFFLILLLKNLNLSHFFEYKNKIFFFLTILCCFIFTGRNYQYFKVEDLLIISKKSFNYSFVTKLGKFDGKDIYDCKWRAAEYPNICVNTVKENYYIKEKFKYTIFLTN